MDYPEITNLLAQVEEPFLFSSRNFFIDGSCYDNVSYPLNERIKEVPNSGRTILFCLKKRDFNDMNDYYIINKNLLLIIQIFKIFQE